MLFDCILMKKVRYVVEMNYIETPWLIISRIFGLVVGIPFTLLGIFWYFQYGNNAFLFNGILWIVAALLLALKGKWNECRLKKIIKNGDCYEATLIEVVPLNMVRIGNYITVRIRCKYKANEVEHSIMSGVYLLSPLDKLDNIRIVVYVSKENKNRYGVVAYREENIFKV